ncbi:cyclin-like protein [Tilletiaria anomala UBC 951]|uniref:Cyclin-like protein n=1 Tax=Tilletiaria anomala (strain ATCC 24038 / CBS 436.72 / UBC 951) TaxID=1037660 RepID=A0A066VBW8_TILAU|nr:cyclin-like protein [Tilletiaria anomala UBC 951]KDN38946.1 cyclin-like protein [Tilletiaria anomala UBC 951]
MSAQTLSENEADESIERSKSLLDPISDVKGKSKHEKLSEPPSTAVDSPAPDAPSTLDAFTNVSASDIPFKSSQTPQLATLTPPSVVELETCAKGFGMHSMDRPGPSSGLVKQAVLGGAAQTNASGPISTVAPNPPTHPSLETPPADQQPTQEEEPEIHIKGKGNITDSASTTAGASVQPSPAAIGSSATTPATGVAMPMFSHANDGHALNDIAINVEEEGEPLRTSETQWWICLRDLEFAPSVMHAGYTVMEERSRRGRSVSFLLRLTDYLRLPINVTSAACIFFHRFFMRQCMTPANGSNIKVGKSFMPQCVAAACVFLACKTEESPRKVVHVIEAAVAASDRTEEGREAFECRDYAKRFGRARRRKDTGEIYDYRLVIDEEEVARDALRPGVKGAAQRDDRLWGPVRWKQNILTTEMWLAQALCFDFIVFHPHEYLIIMARELNFSNKIFWSAWFILVDCFRDPILIAFQRTVLVAAAYKLGCDRWEISPSHLDKHVQSMEVDDDLQETQKQSSSWTWLNAFGVSEFEVAEAARAIEDMQAIHADMTIPVEESLKARIPEMLRREVQRQNRSVAACFPDAVSKPSALRTWKACNAPTPPSLPGPPLPLGPAPAGNGRTPSYMPGSLPSQPSASRIQQNGATVAPPPSAILILLLDRKKTIHSDSRMLRSPRSAQTAMNFGLPSLRVKSQS